jgi:hypothetical protein
VKRHLRGVRTVRFDLPLPARESGDLLLTHLHGRLELDGDLRVIGVRDFAKLDPAAELVLPNVQGRL